MSLFSMLESAGTLKRPVISTTAAHGTAQEPPETIIENVPCSVQPAGTHVQLIYAQRNTIVTTRIYFDQDIGAKVNDYFDVTDSALVTHRFLVKGVTQHVYERFQSPYVMDCQAIQ